MKPMIVELDAPEADPGSAPPIDGGRAVQTARVLGRRGPFRRLAVWVFVSLFTLVLTASAWDFVMGLFAANTMLGWLAFALVMAALAIALVAALREASAFLRMARLDALRARAAGVGA